MAYDSELSVFAGWVVGGLTSGVTTWLNQRSQARTFHELAPRVAKG